jgi:photosystem II stability/assembly factor-like uncharacterized protein
MFRLFGLFLIATIAPVWAATAPVAPCSIQRAAVAGQVIWLLCDDQQLFVSGDQGAKWQMRRLPAGTKLRVVALLDSRRGLVAGDSGTLLATGDGGETWSKVALPVTENLTAIHFVGEMGWLSGWGGVILHSSDGGKSWTRQESGVTLGLDGIFFRDALHGWAVGWTGTILRTSDGGATWHKAQSPAMWSLSAVHFPDLKNGWAVGFNGELLRSRDGGATWERQESPAKSWLTSVLFDGSGRGWIAAQKQLLVSGDGGDSWKPVPLEENLFLRQIVRVNDDLWAIGDFGVVRQTDKGLELRSVATMLAPVS